MMLEKVKSKLNSETVAKNEVSESMDETAEENPEETALYEKRRLDNFYGCDEEGYLCGAMVYMNFKEIGTQYLEESKKRYILRDIDKLHEKISIMHFISAWRGTGKSEWEAMMGYMVLSPVRKAWKKGDSEADITRLFEVTFLAFPTGRAGEETMEFNGTTYRVLTQEKIKEKVMPFFTIQEETEEAIYLTLNVE